LNRAVLQSLCVSRVVDREPRAIEAHHAFLCPDPEIAVPRLGDGLNAVLREPLLGLPDIADILRDRLAGVEGQAWRCQEGGKQKGRRSPAEVGNPQPRPPLGG